MLVLLVCCKEEGPNIVLEHWAVWVIQFFEFLCKIMTRVSLRLFQSKCKISRKLPLINSWISAKKAAMNDSAIRTPFWKLLCMPLGVKALISICSLLAQWRKSMASNMAGIAVLVLFLFSPFCLAKDKKHKTPVIPPNQQLRNENWDRMLKGEWMVKL